MRASGYRRYTQASENSQDCRPYLPESSPVLWPMRDTLNTARFQTEMAKALFRQAPPRPHEQKDPTTHDFWKRAYNGLGTRIADPYVYVARLFSDPYKNSIYLFGSVVVNMIGAQKPKKSKLSMTRNSPV